jgi:hypothetical protein
MQLNAAHQEAERERGVNERLEAKIATMNSQLLAGGHHIENSEQFHEALEAQ